MRRIDPYKMGILLVAMALLQGCVVVPPQHQPQPQPQRAPTVIYPEIVYPYPAPVDYGHEDIRRCRADNQRAHAEVVDYYERARAAGRISPAEARQFSELEARLRNFRTQLARDGLTLLDCQRIGSAIAWERDEVARMARHDPALTRCMADNRWAHRDVTVQYENAKRAGRIDPTEAQRFNAMEAQLQRLRNDLARDGITLQDCQRLGSAIARERDEVTRMTRRDPNVAHCMADNRRAHQAVYDTYNNAVRAGRIDAGEAQRFRGADERLRKFYAALAQDGVSPDECQRLARAIAQERALVDAMTQ